MKAKSSVKALTSVAVPWEAHKIIKKTLSFELVRGYLEKVQRHYKQLEEEPLNLPLKWKKLCRTTADICLHSL